MSEVSDARAQAKSWLAAFDAALGARDVESVTSLFDDECFWRDLVAFTWNVKTLEGRDEIAAMLRANLDATCPSAWRIEGEPIKADGVLQAWIRFETKHARGRGVLRLNGDRAWTLLTTLDELKGFEERKAGKRPKGIAHGVYKRDKTWSEAKHAEEAALGAEKQPYCIIIGGRPGRHCARRAFEAARRTDDHPRKERQGRRFLAQPLPLARAP
jgi:putative flavoprotein involved in K+ transport